MICNLGDPMSLRHPVAFVFWPADPCRCDECNSASVLLCLHFLIVVSIAHDRDSDWIHCIFTAPHCTTLHHTAPHCNTLQHTAPHCNTLHHTATHCTTLQHTAPHCNTLHHTATHCTTLQHTATHRSTLHHTATHCFTLQHTTTPSPSTPSLLLIHITSTLPARTLSASFYYISNPSLPHLYPILLRLHATPPLVSSSSSSSPTPCVLCKIGAGYGPVPSLRSRSRISNSCWRGNMARKWRVCVFVCVIVCMNINICEYA